MGHRLHRFTLRRGQGAARASRTGPDYPVLRDCHADLVFEESHHEKAFRSLRRPLRWSFDRRRVCSGRRHGIALVRNWRRLRHQRRYAWHQFPGHRAFFIRHRPWSHERAAYRHQSRHRPRRSEGRQNDELDLPGLLIWCRLPKISNAESCG